MVTEKTVAVFIDAENVSWKKVPAILTELKSTGNIIVKRMYGDFTRTNMQVWSDAGRKHALIPVQNFQTTSGKNSSDSALIIDVMDLLHTAEIDVYALVTSDGDFTRLAQRLTESGRKVLGFGEKIKTPQAFRASCTKFFELEKLDSEDSSTSPKAPVVAVPAVSSKQPQTKVLSAAEKKIIIQTIAEVSATVDPQYQGWVALSMLGIKLKECIPKFSPNNYGFTSLKPLLESLEECEFSQTEPNANGNIHFRVRVRAQAKSPRKKPLLPQSRIESDQRKMAQVVTQLGQTEYASDDGWVPIEVLSGKFTKVISGFAIKNYGFEKMYQLFEFMDEFEVRLNPRPKSSINKYQVRVLGSAPGETEEIPAVQDIDESDLAENPAEETVVEFVPLDSDQEFTEPDLAEDIDESDEDFEEFEPESDEDFEEFEPESDEDIDESDEDIEEFEPESDEDFDESDEGLQEDELPLIWD